MEWKFCLILIKIFTKILLFMYTTYHLTSAQDLNSDILDAIKTTFKTKPIIIIVEVDDNNYDLNSEMKQTLDDRLEEDEATYLSAIDSVDKLRKKYGV